MTTTAGPSSRVTRTPPPPLDGLSELLEHISQLRSDQIQEAEYVRESAKQRLSSDRVLAFSAFAEEAEALLNVSKDHLSGHDSRRGKDLLDKLIDIEETARYDHMLALALSKGRPPPPMPPRLRRRRGRDLAGDHGATPDHARPSASAPRLLGGAGYPPLSDDVDDVFDRSDPQAVSSPGLYPTGGWHQPAYNFPAQIRHLESVVSGPQGRGGPNPMDDEDDASGDEDYGTDALDGPGDNDGGDHVPEDLGEDETRSTLSEEFTAPEASESFDYPAEDTLENEGYTEDSDYSDVEDPSEGDGSPIGYQMPEDYHELSGPRQEETDNYELAPAVYPDDSGTLSRSSSPSSEEVLPEPARPYMIRFATTALEQVDSELPAGKTAPVQWLLSDSPSHSPPSEFGDVLCAICGGEINGTVLYLACDHTMDVSCLREMFEQAATDEECFPPRCCAIEIYLADVEKHFDPLFVEHYMEKSREFRTKDRVYCYNQYCSAFLGPASDSPLVLRCPQCSYGTCAGCKGKVHRGNACNGPAADEGVLKLGKQKGWQRCVSCRYFVERVEGCPHITCRCGAQFCYLCGKRWSEACSSTCQRQ
ncbi:hypothetical protein C8Q79DRAFT_49464 [Trametes meyenii]|nr:hypothetical protein C8Q79DRAFT_49464 [Trametes meyenii]